jgi:DNA-binding transcriptional ArsR family regulator
MTEEKIVLDKETFKALSVDSRLTILKLLKLRRHTLSELAAELKLSQSTVKEHLAKLEEASLIKQLDEGRKWKYYKLTQKGKNVVDPQEVKVLFMFAVSLFAFLGFSFQMLRNWFSQSMMKTSTPFAAEMLAESAPQAAVRSAPTEEALYAASDVAMESYVPQALETTMQTPDVWLLLVGILAFAGVIISIAYLIIQRKRLQKLLVEERQ